MTRNVQPRFLAQIVQYFPSGPRRLGIRVVQDIKLRLGRHRTRLAVPVVHHGGIYAAKKKKGKF